MKSGKEITLVSHNKNFKIKSGAVINYKAPLSIFLNITSWLLTYEKVKDVDILSKEYTFMVKQFLKHNKHVLKKFHLNNIVDINISPTGIRSNRPTFFELEINLYQKDCFLPLVKPKNSTTEELKPILQDIVNDLLKLPIFAENQNFEFLLTKRSLCEK